jgi:hypothetical protein
MAPNGSYTTQLQAGLGMVAETLALLRVWEPGMIPSRLAERAVQAGVFSRATARRARNLATEMFAPRFLAHEGLAAERMQVLVAHQVPPESISQICFLYTARAQRIFADFVTEVFWPRYHAGAGTLSRKDAEAFVRRAMDAGRMKASPYYERVVDVMEELVKFTLLTRDRSTHLTSRYSERREEGLKAQSQATVLAAKATSG